MMVSECPRVAVEDIERPLFAGVDLGGTSIKIGLVDNQGRTVGATRISTEQELGPKDAMERMATTINELLESEQVDPRELVAVGLGTPGTMDIPAGMILEPPNLPAWRHFPVRDELSKACQRPVAYANDAAAAAYGEFWIGTGQQFNSMVLLTLGTGVGGGIIIGDQSIDGENSHGSECGHVLIDSGPGARLCSCGQPGHLEAYASATAVVKRTKEALQEEPSSSLHQRLEGEQELTTLILYEEATRGDTLSQRIVMETADYLALGIISLVHTIDPGIVVLGGAMTFGGNDDQVGREFLARIRSQFQEQTFPVLAERTRIDFAALGSSAGYIGAAGIARLMYKRTQP
jgi:glucokinase